MATGNATTEHLVGGSWTRLNTHAIDVLLAAAFTIGAALVLFSRGSSHAAGYDATDALDWILVLATSVPLALLRLWPTRCSPFSASSPSTWAPTACSWPSSAPRL
jgi:hypothetical protein